MNPVFNFNCADTPASLPPPTTPGNFSVRARYQNQLDAGHLYGPFSTREAAERCVLVLSSRTDVLVATIESAPTS